jgi:inner membrane protein
MLRELGRLEEGCDAMDTVTHGLLGAAAAQGLLAHRLPKSAGLIGLVAGMAPDLDILMGLGADPVASILYHRQSTHSLIFIPVGALCVALLFMWMRSFKGARLAVYGAALIGYGLHGPLDACTSYGTLLLWPFSYTRIAWDVIAIVDPIFSLTLLVGLVWALVRRHARLAQVAVCLALIYLGFGVWQWQRARDIQLQLATARGQVIERGRAMPLPGGLVAWRSVYVAAGEIHVDGIRVPWWRGALVKPGGTVDLASFDLVPPPMAERQDVRRAFEVFAWFADGLIAPVDGVPATIGDMRYGAEASSLRPLWGMQFDGARPEGAMRWRPPGSSRLRIATNIWHMMIDAAPDYRPVDEVLSSLHRRSGGGGLLGGG